MHNKRIYILVPFIIILFLFAVAISDFSHQLKKQNGLIVTLFQPKLQKASDDFYSAYLSDNPCVASYSGELIDLTKTDEGYCVKFHIQPYTGPHFPVGDDEVEYFVDNIGDVTLLSFAHKKTYELPERLGVIVKKPIPIS